MSPGRSRNPENQGFRVDRLQSLRLSQFRHQSPKGAPGAPKMEAKAASGPPWGGEISPKNSPGDLPEDTDEFVSAPGALQERFRGLLRRTPNFNHSKPPPRGPALTKGANWKRQLLTRTYVDMG